MTWRDKIRTGYLYRIGSDEPGESGRIFMACTGYGGAINYGEALEKEGIPDDLIQESILITQDMNLMSNSVWTPIKNIHWYKKDSSEAL